MKTKNASRGCLDPFISAMKPGIDEARAGFLFFFFQPLLAFFFLLMAVARAKPGLHVNHGRRGGWSTGSPPAGFVAGQICLYLKQSGDRKPIFKKPF